MRADAVILTHDYDLFNLIANTATALGGLIMLWGIFVLKKQTQRLESVLAPKTGIEGFLNMCQQVVESDPDGTCVVSDDGEIVLVNRKMEDISGYPRSELVGKPIEVLVPEGMRTTHRHHRESFVTDPSSRAMRGLVLRHKRGRELAVGIRLNRYMDSTGGYTIAKVRVPDNE